MTYTKFAPVASRHRKPYLHRIFFDIGADLVSTFAVQSRATESSEWETVIMPSNLTPAVYLYRDAAEEHLKALKAAQ